MMSTSVKPLSILFSFDSYTFIYLQVGITLHEVGHALGLMHEHQTKNRDKYIRVLLENMDKENRQWFSKLSYVDNYGSPYDMSSLMHYGVTVSLYLHKTI